MKNFSDREELRKALEECRKSGSFSEVSFSDGDLSGLDFSGLDCSWWTMKNVCLDGCVFGGSRLDNGKFEHCSFRNADFHGGSLVGTDLRAADLTCADIQGADILCAWLEQAKLEGIKQDEHTRHFRMACPASGAFIGYKKCYENRVVMLLIPADAKRVSATNNACRCDKAKVLTITSPDFSESYTWANSLVDENFIYRVGQIMVPDRFTEDRWVESTYGIHFWMSREEALAY